MTTPAAALPVLWTHTNGDLEHRVIQDGAIFLLLTRRLYQDGRDPKYVYWSQAHRTLAAAQADVPNAENVAAGRP